MEFMATREDIAELKALIESKENRLLKWLVGTTIAAAGVMAMAVFMLARALSAGVPPS